MGANRFGDMEKAAKDREYLELLLEEYHLKNERK